MEYYKLINKELDKKYGRELTTNLPKFRIVQNINLMEVRIGTFERFMGDLFLGRDFGAQEVPKYDYVPDGYWILEEIAFNDNPELPVKITYEPRWIFYWPVTFEYQKPNLKACIHIVERIFAQRRGEILQMPTEEEIKAFGKAKIFEELGGRAGISDKLHGGEGISVPSSFERGL